MKPKRLGKLGVTRGRLCTLAALGLLGLGSGCTLGGQTGTEDTPSKPPSKVPRDPHTAVDTGEGNCGGCQPKSRVVEAGDAAALGFSEEDMLALAEGSHETSLEWRSPSTFDAMGATGSFSSEQGAASIALKVSYDDGEVRLVHFVPREQGDAGATRDIGMAPACPRDRLEVDVKVKLKTGGGALDESFDAVLVADNPYVVTLSSALELDSLKGTFESSVTATDASVGTATVGPLTVSASFYDGGTSGTLSSNIDLESDQVAGRGFVQYAQWPAGDPCTTGGAISAPGPGGLPVPLESAFAGVSASEALASLESVSGVPFAWADGSATELSLAVTPDGNTACVVVSEADTVTGSQVTLTALVAVALSTADGRVDTVLTGTLELTSSPESLPAVARVQAELSCEDGDLAAQCGVSALDAADYDALLVALVLDSELPTGASTLSGSLTLTGIRQADCSVEPPPEDPNAGATPGCAGDTRIEIDQGAISAREVDASQ